MIPPFPYLGPAAHGPADQGMVDVEHFLQHLPKVESEDLPPEHECMICQIPYSTVNDEGKSEHAVRLECGHVVGSNVSITMI